MTRAPGVELHTRGGVFVDDDFGAPVRYRVREECVHGWVAVPATPWNDARRPMRLAGPAMTALAKRSAMADRTDGSFAMACAAAHGVRNQRALAGQRVGGSDPQVETRAFEKAAHRNDESLREQQHVEQQRADGRDAEDAKRRTRRLANEASPRKSHRVHRRASLRPLRRSSAHDATTVAETPSGTAIATQIAATSGVTRTKISAVS